MRLVITGGSGYLGTGILNRAPKEWQIAATYLTHPLAGGNAAAFRVDVRDTDGVNRLLGTFQPDLVIHTAAQMTGDQMLPVNAEGSRTIARAAARLNARLIHLSSDVIFDGEHAPYDESALPVPVSAYAESKARAEQAVKNEYPRAVIVRTSLIYGFDPLDPRTRQILNGEMPRLFTDEFRCPIFVDDLADALLELAADDFAGVIHIAGPQRLSRYEFGVKMVHALETTPRFAPALSATHPGKRPRDCTLNVSLAQRRLRTHLRSVDEVLQRPFGFSETQKVHK